MVDNNPEKLRPNSLYFNGIDFIINPSIFPIITLIKKNVEHNEINITMKYFV